jgi:hypothetical protein
MRRQTLIALVFASSCAAPVVVGPAPGIHVVERTGGRALRRSIDSIVRAPEFANGHWGVLVVDTRGDTLYSHNAGKLFMPASNQKILTSSVALAQLGPDYRYHTAFIGHGPIVDSVLRRKIGGPSAGARHHGTLTDQCERELPEDYLSRHDLGFCFASKRDLLLFELFEELFVRGRGADPAGITLAEFLRERSGRAATAGRR